MARVRSEGRYPALWIRLLALRSVLVAQSFPWAGSAGGLSNGTYVFVCSASPCRQGARGIRKDSTNSAKSCCGKPMYWARYRADGGSRTLQTMTPLDLYICVKCAWSSDAAGHCTVCRTDTLVKFGA
ncbi:hypothetical protein ACFWU3_25180 [Streptomyces sp. NPDC058685]|uniref:hypothetical protein n=1 Tax=Streptomyces sp. NPDC058685 TaxID=3346598 RepID=UPI003663D3A2